MTEVHRNRDEHGVPIFTPWTEGTRLLMDPVRYTSALNTYRGPGSNTIKGVGLWFESRTAEGHQYSLILDPDDARKLIAEVTKVLDQQEAWDREAGLDPDGSET